MSAKAKELKEALKFITALANVAGKVSEDGKLTLSDIPYFIPLIYKMPSAVDGISKIPAEIKELTEEDLEEIIKMIKDDLDLPRAKTNEIIKDSIEICVKIYALAKKIRD